MNEAVGPAPIGRYRLEGLLGEGASAQVWRGSDALLRRAVAVKILKPSIAADSALAGRFFNEARAMAGLSDPAIVQIYDVIAEGERNALVMEYVDGPSLAHILESGAIGEERAVAIARDVARALGVAHAAGILHRDIKPANVLSTAAGSAKVTDFGLAKALAEDDGGVTMAGGLVGSTHYISPEQAQGLPLTPASDLYSLGVVLFQMLTGRVPFSGDSAIATAVAHVREPVPSEAVLSESMSPALAAIVHRLLAKDPAARYPNAAALEDALKDVAAAHAVGANTAWDGPTILGGAVIPRPPRRAPRWRPAAAALLALLVALAAAAGAQWKRTAPLLSAKWARTTGSLRGLAARHPQWRPQRLPARFAVALVAAIIGLGIVAALAAAYARRDIAVANVQGLRADRARSIVQSSGLTALVVHAPSASVPVGSVSGENPAAGTMLAPGKAVTLSVSSGPPLVAVPALDGMGREVARAMLERLGLKVHFAESASEDPVDSVVDQVPSPGTAVKPGSGVAVVLSAGPPVLPASFFETAPGGPPPGHGHGRHGHHGHHDD